MYILKTSAAFDSAHFLYGYKGKCANIHGHRWVIEVQINGDSLVPTGSKKGMLVDFSDFKNLVKEFADNFDHALIYETGSLKPATVGALNSEGFRLIALRFRPTAENLAKHFYDELKKKKLSVLSVTVYETPENCAVYKEE